MAPLFTLLFAAAFDGQAALRHASALAALGPHPWGSPRAAAAAQYVASQLRDAGLSEVRLQGFEASGTHGFNVIGVLPAPGPEFVVVGAHHDTAPEAPGAYDDGGGVGVLIEAARAQARRPSRPRTLVFVSWDGEEAWSTGQATTTGSRAYIQSLGPEARNMVAALAIEMCGWKRGTPVFHPIAYADPFRPGAYTVTPEWLIRAAQAGGRAAGAPLRLGDPLLSWLYQPAVRSFRARLYGDDLSFLQAGLPALFVSDSSFTAFYPWYHQPTDTADKLDALSLARMGQGVLGVVEALGRTPRGSTSDPHWFAAFGGVIGGPALTALAGLSLVPGLWTGFSVGGATQAARLFHAALFGILLWRNPVPVLWVFFLPNLASVWTRRWWALGAFLPALALAGLGALARVRGFVEGTWFEWWELLAAALAILALGVGPSRSSISGGHFAR